MRTLHPRGFTLIELLMAVAIFSVASVMTLQVLMTTSRNMDTETKESDLQKRTTGRLYTMLAEMEGISPTQDSMFKLANQGSMGLPPGYPIPLITTTTDGVPLVVPTNSSTVADSITFRPALGTNATGIVWGNPVRYRWAQLMRGGIPVPSMGILVKETLDPTGTIVRSTEELEENVPMCDYQYDPTATPPKFPTGFAVIQSDVETTSSGTQLVGRQRVLTISLQRAQDLRTTVTASNGNSIATSTITQTIFLKTP